MRKRDTLIMAVVLLCAVFSSVYRKPAAATAETVEFMKAGGYKEEYFAAWTVEVCSETDTVVMNYELEELVSVRVNTTDDELGRVSIYHNKGDLHKKTPYGFRWGSMAADDIVKELMGNHGFTEYTVYPTK